MVLKHLIRHTPPDVLNFLVRRESVRKVLLRRGEEKLHHAFMVENPDNRPPLVQEHRYLMLKNLLHALNRALSDNRISSQVSKALIKNFIGRIVLSANESSRSFLDRHGMWPPDFLTISPTKRCNLNCKGCYASSSADSGETLAYSVFNRILQEKKELWGAYFTVISGGEPLLYEDDGKSLFDIFEENHDDYFMVYTNGTLITKDVARRMAALGNITPAISVEGFEKETDERRGKGIYKKILQAMENLREAGVPFGISLTATRHNVDCILSNEVVELYFNRLGAIYGWIFQYMPIGRSYTMDLVITPEQRLALFESEQKMIKESNAFLVDFWNGGPYSVGCNSAGRPGGYFYIDWNGNIAPCVFFPYYQKNIYDLYQENKTLNDVLFSPYFESIRNWQNDYGYTQPPEKVKNYIVPCPIRDHYGFAHSIITRFDAKPMDADAASALEDAAYHERMVAYGKEVQSLTQPHWEQEFCGHCQMDPEHEGRSKEKTSQRIGSCRAEPFMPVSIEESS